MKGLIEHPKGAYYTLLVLVSDLVDPGPRTWLQPEDSMIADMRCHECTHILLLMDTRCVQGCMRVL